MNQFIRRVLTLTILLFVCNSTYGQTRYCEIYPVIVQPDSGHLFQSPGQEQITVAIVNLGPDKLVETDQYGIYFNIGSIKGFPKFGTLGSNFNVGDTFYFIGLFNLEFTGDTDSTPFCTEVTLYSTIDTLYFKPGMDIRKIKDCITVRHRDTLSSTSLPFKTDLLSVWPNPSNGVIRIATNSIESRSVRVYSSTAVLVYSTDAIDTDLLIIDLSHTEGLYTIEMVLESGSVLRKKLLVIR